VVRLKGAVSAFGTECLRKLPKTLPAPRLRGSGVDPLISMTTVMAQAHVLAPIFDCSLERKRTQIAFQGFNTCFGVRKSYIEKQSSK